MLNIKKVVSGLITEVMIVSVFTIMLFLINIVI